MPFLIVILVFSFSSFNRSSKLFILSAAFPLLDKIAYELLVVVPSVLVEGDQLLKDLVWKLMIVTTTLKGTTNAVFGQE